MGWENAVEAFDDGASLAPLPVIIFNPLSLASAIDIAQFDVPVLAVSSKIVSNKGSRVTKV
jgi:hypothetical protein